MKSEREMRKRGEFAISYRVSMSAIRADAYGDVWNWGVIFLALLYPEAPGL